MLNYLILCPPGYFGFNFGPLVHEVGHPGLRQLLAQYHHENVDYTIIVKLIKNTIKASKPKLFDQK
jgi:hypothetical protein